MKYIKLFENFNNKLSTQEWVTLRVGYILWIESDLANEHYENAVKKYELVKENALFKKLLPTSLLAGIGNAYGKIKNLEAMIYGIPIVTTPLGLDGLSGVGEAGGVTVATSSKCFAQELQSLLINEDRCCAQQNIAADWINANILPASHWRHQITQLLHRVIST